MSWEEGQAYLAEESGAMGGFAVSSVPNLQLNLRVYEQGKFTGPGPFLVGYELLLCLI